MKICLLWSEIGIWDKLVWYYEALTWFNIHLDVWLVTDRLIGQPETRARNHNRPQEVLTLAGHFIDDITVGSEHTLALTSDGQVLAWGSNGEGQLGLGHTSAVWEPQCVTMLSGKTIRQVDFLVLFRCTPVSWKNCVICYLYKKEWLYTVCTISGHSVLTVTSEHHFFFFCLFYEPKILMVKSGYFEPMVKAS